MDEAKNQLVKKIQDSSNVLVTVSSNPSVDQLAACIGLTLVLNKLGKHATAVFSGKVPDTLEFLKPQETLENNTDSLRDFIISLDKSKADKLRYKVEDKVVKIFITPYRTSITQDDLDFSQGDFNVDVVIALGVHEQKDLDQAITAHGRILHDATVVAVNRDIGASVGTINVLDNAASSLCELLVPLSEQLKSDVMDEQVATAYLTGIVAETNRFSNEKTTSNTMNISARLMGAGANQQLVATKLQEHDIAGDQPHFDPLTMNELAHDEAATQEDSGDGALNISHESPAGEGDEGVALPKELDDIHVDAPAPETDAQKDNDTKLILEPPTLGGTLTASHEVNAMDPGVDPLSLPAVNPPLLRHDGPAAQNPQAQHYSNSTDSEIPDLKTFLKPQQPAPQPAPVEVPQPESTSGEPAQTLTDLEQSVNSPHVQQDAPAPEEPEDTTKGGMHVINPLPDTANPLPDLNQLAAAEAAPPAESPQATQDSDVITPAPDAASAAETTEPQANVDEARDAVLQAINASTEAGPLNPIAALNAQPIDLNAPADTPADSAAPEVPATTFNPDAYGIESAGVTGEEFRMPENLVDPNAPLPPDPTAASVTDPTAPPPVPPPMIPPLNPDNLPPSQESDDQPPSANPFNLPPTS